jgi:tetratricopeptide (TPR) repeat protein
MGQHQEVTKASRDKGVFRAGPKGFMVCLIALAVMPVACSRVPADSENTLKQTEPLLAQQHWDAAIPLLKQRLLERPRDAAAHFYLGRCYLNGSRPALGVAEGEFQVALSLFYQDGRRSPITEFSDDYFELRCCLEMAKARLRQLQFAMAVGASPTVIRQLIQRCQDTADQARRVAPDAAEVKQLQEIINNIRRPSIPPLPPRRPESAVPA